MKPQKKPLGTKAQLRAARERGRRIATVIFLIFILSMAIISAYSAYTLLSPPPGQSFVEPTLQFKPENPNPKLKAAIVDQVSLTFPNQTFVQMAANILEQANYSVDYYSGENVTVAFFRYLPANKYGILILRVHSSADELEGTRAVEVPVVIFTSQLYSGTEYVDEQLADQLFQVKFEGDSQTYFAIGPSFVTSSMKGTFRDTLVIMMGCEGLNNTEMAKAFIGKGAKTYISWNGSVSPSSTDEATIRLLQHLIPENETVSQAVGDTMHEVGLDQAYDSQLTFYPP